MSSLTSPTQARMVLKLLPKKFLNLTVYKWTISLSLLLAVTSTAREISSVKELVAWLCIGALGHLAMLPFVLYGRNKDLGEQILLLLLMGFVRGAVIGIFAPIFNVEDSLTVIVRAVNSMLAVFYWFQAGAIIVEYGSEFRNKLRQLLNEVLEKNIVNFSSQAKESNNKIVEIIGFLQEKIVKTVGSSPSKEELLGASEEIDRLINDHIKPLSYSHWKDGDLIWVRSGFFAVLRRTLSHNPIPVVGVFLLTWPFTIVGQVSRIGVAQTVLVQFTWTTLAYLLIRIVYHKIAPEQILRKNMTFLIALPVVYFLTFVIQYNFPISSNQSLTDIFNGYLISGLSQIALYLVGSMLLAIRNDQEFAFQFIADAIKAGELEHLLEKTKSGNLDSNYAQYLHAEVQSQLLACKLLLLKAAESDFSLFPPEITKQIVDRLERLKQPYEKPPARIPSQRLAELQKSWDGLARLSYNCSSEFDEFQSFSDVTSQLIEEAVVNSIRHGKATEIQVSGSTSGDFITVEVRDNGSLSSSGKSHRGLGTILFETLADSWQLVGGSSGSVLTFTVKTDRTETRK
jgi:hypothetical protein